MCTEDKSWVFDSLVCFLNGPIWNAPLQSFIEEKSLIFEPNDADNPEYRNIFEEFKNLVDFMLSNFMDDIGITSSQFEESCNTGSHEPIVMQFEQSLFEQIRAANDFELFKKMMVQRNVELQLQALDLIQEKYGITPQSFLPQKNEKVLVVKSDESASKTIDLEDEIMQDVGKQFPAEVPEGKEELKFILEEKEILENKLKAIEENLKHGFSKPTQKSPKKQPEIDVAELKKRREYLRSQRDKLVALKKEARKKHLDVDSSREKDKKTRAKSAKAAQGVLKGKPVTMDSQELQIRKALAERLRAEVVEKE